MHVWTYDTGLISNANSSSLNTDNIWSTKPHVFDPKIDFYFFEISIRILICKLLSLTPSGLADYTKNQSRL